LIDSNSILPEFHNKLKLEQGFGFGYGVEGIRDMVQWAPNTASIYPLSRFSSRIHPESESRIDPFVEYRGLEEYKDFVEKWERVVLISFGATH